MPKYIDVNALGIGKANPEVFVPPEYAHGWNSAVEFVLTAPAADVVAVRHGRWFLDGDYEYINCSECLYPFYMGFDTSSDARQYLAREERWKYCPNCGARMDLKGDADV